MSDPVPWPTEIRLRQEGRELSVAFDSGQTFDLSAEYLRVLSPSAENKGHFEGERPVAHGKRLVRIVRLEPVGNYAIRIVFDDGHETGLFSWAYLHELGSDHGKLLDGYLARLTASGKDRG
jgi:DUF971 family protein